MKKKLQKWLVSISAIVLAFVCVGAIYSVVHAASISIAEIDYEKLTLTVQANEGDSRIFFSTTKSAKNWDEIVGEMSADHKVTMDISWVSTTKDTSIYLKGDKSTEPIRVILPKQNTKFKASLNLTTSKFTFSNDGSSNVIYWRKSTATEWNVFNQADQSEMKNLLESYSLKGISLAFRTGQVKGTSVESVGERPSKISVVKISKRASAPSVSLNYSTMTFAVKKTMEYKLSKANEWKEITATTLDLKSAMPEVLYDNNGKNMGDDETIGIDFRTKATTKSVASQTKTIEVAGQKNTETENIQLSYTGSTQLKILIENKETKDAEGKDITLKEASTENPYEYAVVKEGEELDIYKDKWTAITTACTKVSSTTAPEGSKIYIRTKSKTNKLPGKEQLIESNVHYIEASKLNEQEYKLEKIQGLNKELTFAICVSSEETEVSSITFNEAKAGFKASKPEKVEGVDGKYIVTVTINNTTAIEAIASNLETEMKAVITLSNTETIKDGVTLCIHKAAKLDNASYTVYSGYGFVGGNETNGDLSFEVCLNKKAEELESAKISSITYNGIDVANTKYSATEPDSEGKVKVTMPKENVSALAATSGSVYVSSYKYGTAYPLVVKLANGETLENIKVTIEYPVKVSTKNTSLGLSVSSYEDYLDELENAKLLNSDPNPDNDVALPTTYSNPEITYTLQNDIKNRDSSFNLTSLTWNGKNVLAQTSGSAGSFKVVVDLKKVVASSKRGSENLVMTLTNSQKETIVVDYGFQITLTD